MAPDQFLHEGARILSERLGPLGYDFAIVEPPLDGSGGPYAWGAFKRSEREIRLWARYDRLGSVHYRLGSEEFTHQEYMRALGMERSAQWPGFDDGDPLGGFKRLLTDLEHCGEFLTGNATFILDAIRALPPQPTGFQALRT